MSIGNILATAAFNALRAAVLVCTARLVASGLFVAAGGEVAPDICQVGGDGTFYQVWARRHAVNARALFESGFIEIPVNATAGAADPFDVVAPSRIFSDFLVLSREEVQEAKARAGGRAFELDVFAQRTSSPTGRPVPAITVPDVFR